MLSASDWVIVGAPGQPADKVVIVLQVGHWVTLALHHAIHAYDLIKTSGRYTA